MYKLIDMAKKTKKSFSEGETIPELQATQEDSNITPAVVTANQVPAVKPAPAVKPKQPAAKKRVRVRKKATKHLSVAVLCTNPLTRRFI